MYIYIYFFEQIYTKKKKKIRKSQLIVWLIKIHKISDLKM